MTQHTSSTDGAKAPELNTTPTPPKKNRLVPWIIGLPVAIFGALMLIGTFLDDPRGEERWVAQEAIKICWKQTAKPPEERKTQKFQSKEDCDQLEFAFKSKYNENP